MGIPEEIAQLIGGSGNNFHTKVARWMKTQGWHVTISPYYMDQSQQKAREIDLIAERAWPIKDYSNSYRGDVLVRLFIECKFVAAPSVFWFAPKNEKAAIALVCSTGPFTEGNTYTRRHHYLDTTDQVAKLFASKGGGNSENEPFYKALNQALNAFVSMRSQPPSIEGVGLGTRSKLEVLQFPVVVCNSFDKLYAVDILEEKDATRIENNFQLEVQYAYVNRSGSQFNDYFLLDFVEYEKLSLFMSAIEKDAEAAVYLASD